MGKNTAEKKEVSIVEALKLAEDYLTRHEVSSPRLSSELILSHILQCSRLDLYLRFDEKLSGDELTLFRESLKKRAEHFPVQYITGEVEFFSLPFRVEEGVFIPRPETELLVEWVEEIVGGEEELWFVEFGVGSGVISGTLASRHPGWKGVAVDISEKAVRCALDNFRRLGVSDRVSLLVSDGFGSLQGGKDFDIVVANPPYIPTGSIKDLEPEVSIFENRTALDGGENGLAFYPVIVREGIGLLKEGGVMILEVGHGQMDDVSGILRDAGFVGVEGRKDYNGFERLVKGMKRESSGGG